MKKRILAVAMAAALFLSLTACGNGSASSSSASSGSSSSMPDESSTSAMVPVDPPDTSEPDVSVPDISVPDEPPAPVYINPLTGEITETDISQNRPIAVMINNLKKALPQLGVGQADIIYEMPAEGGITRMMAVFQSAEGVGEIGSVRSARDYYISLAYGHDAIFLHAGGSPQAYSVIKNWGVTALDCVNGPYEGTLFWRDQDRRENMGLEHSVLTSGAKIQELLPTYKKISKTHKDGFVEPFSFLAEGAVADGRIANKIEVNFSGYKTGVFHYERETGLYNVEEYGKEYVDGNTGEQVKVKNVLVLFTDVDNIKGDSAGRLSVRTTGTGSGQFFCDGMAQTILWSKASHNSPMVYTTPDGQPLLMGVGSTYVNVVDASTPVFVE